MNKNALIIIDAQNYFVNKFTKSLPEKIAKHMSKTDYDFVVFTKFINKKGSNFFKLLNWKKCLSGPETEIHNSLIKFARKENVFTKNSYSIFKAKGINEYFQKNKIKSLYLCGVDTDACVLASAFEGFDLGYDVKIIKELCCSHSGKSFHNSALKIIKKHIE
ncbi:cysteine hydrolase [Patescibacteria group bacterium]|nr:cysteine hydrolase [Patescibacteria group bacterium]